MVFSSTPATVSWQNKKKNKKQRCPSVSVSFRQSTDNEAQNGEAKLKKFTSNVVLETCSLEQKSYKG